jgi:hypothetical protein
MLRMNRAKAGFVARATEKCLVVGGAMAILVGCGGADETSASLDVNAVDFGSGTFARCLKKTGAKFADSMDDLGFFVRAEDDERASYGIRYDETAKLFVELWEDARDPRMWLMWSAQPFDESKSPPEIVLSGKSGSYVAYIREPTRRQRHAAQVCTVPHGSRNS